MNTDYHQHNEIFWLFTYIVITSILAAWKVVDLLLWLGGFIQR